MSFEQFLQIIGLVLTAVTVLSVAYVALRTKLMESTGQLWKDEATALRTRLETVESENVTLKERVAALEGTNAMLADQVTGATAIKEHDANVRALHAEVMAAIWALGASRAFKGEL